MYIEVRVQWTIKQNACTMKKKSVSLLLYMYIVYDSPLNLLDIGL